MVPQTVPRGASPPAASITLDTFSSGRQNGRYGFTTKARATVAELAEKAGVDAQPARLGFLRSVLKKWKSRPPTTEPGLVIFVGEDAPRDLDDPLSDPKAQARLGEAIAKRARKRK